MAKAKKGMKVRHKSTGKTGIVSSVLGGVIRVVFPDGTEASGYAGSYSKAGRGCLLILILPAVLIILGGAYLDTWAA